MITVVANYRTSSSTFVENLSKLTGLSYDSSLTGEWLHQENFGGQFGYRPPIPKYQIYKIMPDHVRERDFEKFRDEYLVNSQVFYLVRKDIVSQYKSLAASIQMGLWHPWQRTSPKEWYADHEIDELTMDIAESTLQHTIPRQHYFYTRFPGQVVYCEDREQKRYTKRNVSFSDDQIDRIKYFVKQFPAMSSWYE